MDLAIKSRADDSGQITLAVSGAIDRGVPLMGQTHTEIARAFHGLANVLTQNDDDVKRSAWSLFKTV